MELNLYLIYAFHSNWTKPYMINNKSSMYAMDDFAILTTILSALKWREKNGKIKMITDEAGAEFYESHQMTDLWDLGIDVILDNVIPQNIDAKNLWAAGKIYSLKHTKNPCAMIDTDMIIWESIYNKIKFSKLSVIHKEPLDENYPNKNYFSMNDTFKFHKDLNWNIEPVNTSFMYINSVLLKEYYVNSSIEFMTSIKQCNSSIKEMIFAEQRLLSMCAEKLNINVNSLYTLRELLYKNQKYFTHLWGLKSVLLKNRKARENFCLKCINRIISDFPEYEYLIANNYEFKDYYIKYKIMHP